MKKMNLKTRYICRKCHTTLTCGKALQNVATGIPDFIEGKEVCTVSYGKEAVLISVLKCPSCGQSVSTGDSCK